MWKVKRRYLITGIVIIFICLICIVTNPSKQDYLHFIEVRVGEPTPLNVEVKRINFF